MTRWPKPSTPRARTAASFFLVKLALLNANALGSADVFQAHLDIALQDL